MTLSESSSLTPEQLRVAVAERLGWKLCDGHNPEKAWWLIPGKKSSCHVSNIPHYDRDLNACHEFEEWLREKQHTYDVFVSYLVRIASPDHDRLAKEYSDEDIRYAVFATATQRCRAFLAVTSKVTENRNE